MTGTWMFLGVQVDILTGPDAPVVVAEGVLPQGASPPLHVHDDLDGLCCIEQTGAVCGRLLSPGFGVRLRAGVRRTRREAAGRVFLDSQFVMPSFEGSV